MRDQPLRPHLLGVLCVSAANRFPATFMRVRVLFFGMLKDLMGRSVDELSLPEGSTLADLVARYEQAVPRLREYSRSIALSLNQQYAAPAALLNDNDEVALLPPVSGGRDRHVGPDGPGSPARAAVARDGVRVSSGQAERSSAKTFDPPVRIVHSRIIPHDIVPPLERPEDGAIVIFDGIVRNHSRGRPTLHLEYEAYEDMALAEMRSLRAQALEKFKIRDAAIVHRLGRLEIGESSVLIAVFAAHRAAAFDACRWLIDTLKRTVPIWKKEFFADGAVWADGEPFPADLPTAAPAIPAASATPRAKSK